MQTKRGANWLQRGVAFCMLFMFSMLQTGAWLPAMAQEAGWNVLLIPNKKEYLAWPGDTLRGSILVRNDGDVALENLVAVVVDFGPNTEETGDPQIIEADENYRYRLAPWVEFSSEPVTIPAGGSIDLAYTINVPADAEPGGHYGMIYVQLLSQGEGETSLGILSKLGSLLLVTVRGEVETKGEILEFYAGQKLYEYLPVDLYTRIQNTGNVHIRPVGNIFIYDWRDKQVGMLSVNESAGVVLPESVRKFQSYWTEAFLTNDFVRGADGTVQRNAEGEQKRQLNIRWEDWNLFRLGRYTARALIVYEDDNLIEHRLEATTYFWVIPWKMILAIIFGILFLTFLIRWLIRKYNDRLISRYEKGQGNVSPELVEALRKQRKSRQAKRAQRRERLRSRLRNLQDRAKRILRWQPESQDTGAPTESSVKPKEKHDVFHDPDRTD